MELADSEVEGPGTVVVDLDLDNGAGVTVGARRFIADSRTEGTFHATKGSAFN